MNTPSISVSSSRKAIMYSLTRVSTFQLAAITSGIINVVRHHKQDRNAVNAQTVLKTHQPLCLVDELEAGVWTGSKSNRMNKRDQERDCCGDQCQPFCIAPRRGVFAPQEHSQNKRRKAGHEGNDGKQVMIH